MNLNFHKYLQGCIQRITHETYMLSKIRRYIDFNTAITIYKTMILPVLEYGDVAYDNTDTNLLKKLQVLQNRALRICLNRQEHIPTVILHRECKIAKLESRRIAHLRMFMFKQLNNELIVNRRNVFTRAHDAPLFITSTVRPNNEKYKRNIYYKGALKWNELSVTNRKIDRNRTHKFSWSALGPPYRRLLRSAWLLRTYSSPGSSIRSPHPGSPQGYY